MTDYKVEIAFNANWSTAAGSRVWTDVTEWVEADGIGISVGRADERSTADANSLSLVLDNTDGRFTPKRSSSPYYPNVKVGRPVRVTATPVGEAASVRFLGFVDSWGAVWPGGSDAYSTANLTASSRLSRLGLSDPLPSLPTLELPNLVRDEYFPLFVNRAGWSLHGANSAGSVSFASPDNGAITDGLPAAKFVKNGKRLQRSKEGTRTVAVTFAVSLPFSPDTSEVYLWQDRVQTDATSTEPFTPLYTAAYLGVDSAGRLWVKSQSGEGFVPTAEATGPFVADGELHTAVLTVDGGDLKVYSDGQFGMSVTRNPGTNTAMTGVVQTLGGEVANQSGNTPTFPGFIGRAVMRDSGWAAADAALYHDIFVAGFAGESPGDRLGRYAGYGGIGAASFAAGATPISHIDTTGQSPLQLMRRVEESDGGVLFDAPDGTLTYVSRTARYNATASATLDAAVSEVTPDYRALLDRSALTNEVEASVSTGDSVTYRNQVSIDEYARHRRAVDLAIDDLIEAHAMASWEVNTYAEPDLRAPTLGVDLEPESASRQSTMLGLGVGDRVTVNNLPSQAAASTEDVFIEGYSEDIGVGVHRVAFNTTDAAPWLSIFRLDDTNGLSQLDNGNVLGR